jgi:hypothetical protein
MGRDLGASARSVAEAPAAGIVKYCCTSCTVLIGPGYLRDELWYDPVKRRVVCWSCARRLKPRPGVLLVGRRALVETPAGLPLLRLINARIRQATRRDQGGIPGGNP